jgi:hypothetical protein
VPQFYRPQSSWGGAWGKRVPLQSGRTLPATLARLLMQLHGSSQVSPQNALGNESVRARAQTSGVQAAVCFAGVAQLVEHLFCKQVVRGSSPRASSAVGPSVGSTGGGACGFRVLASFGLRSDAHALKCVPLRSSPKPRHNAELRRRVIEGRPLGLAAAAVRGAAPMPMRSASSLARAASLTSRETSESCPSGQREQAVNLPAFAYAGSNPALSTSARLRRASVSISCLGELSSPSAEVNSAEPPPQVSGSLPRNSAAVSFTTLSGLESQGTNRGRFCFTVLGRGRSRAMTSFAGVAQLVERQLLSRGELSSPPSEVNSAGAPPQVSGPQPQNSAIVRLGVSSLAGVAQLVERQPSKLNVEGSSPFSRSASRAPGGALVFGSVSHRESKQAQTFGQTRVGSLVAGEAEPRTGAERTLVREHRTAGEVKPASKIPTRRHRSPQRHCHAHLAQMVEHVLGKDEVTSSILVVGSKP